MLIDHLPSVRYALQLLQWLTHRRWEFAIYEADPINYVLNQAQKNDVSALLLEFNEGLNQKDTWSISRGITSWLNNIELKVEYTETG